LAGNEELSSGGLGVLGEEVHEEGGSNDQWNVQHQKHHGEVPVNVIIKDQEVVHRDQVNGEQEGENTDGNNTALDWEATAAGGADGVFVGAHAKAAAAWGHDVLLWDGFFGSSGLL